MTSQPACGTEQAYQRHRYRNEVTCRRCCDAHAVTVANWRAEAAIDAGPIEPSRYRRALAGDEPAEALLHPDRARLVLFLHRRGLPDAHIASHTRMTTYTAARIRSSLGLAPNENGGSAWPASTPASCAPSGARATTSASAPPTRSASTSSCCPSAS